MQPLRRKLKCRAPFDAHLTFGPVSRGPAARVTRDDWWRAMNSPEGRVTVHVHVDRARAALDVAAWGPGRDWALERAPELTGLADDPRHFAPAHPILTDLHHRLGGLRLVRLGAALDVTAATILEQRVTSVEAARAWRGLVFRHGAPAPGNAALRVPPSAEVLRQLPDWEWRRLGVEQRRSATVRAVAADATRLDRAAGAGHEALDRRLRATRGVGPWTAATVRHYVDGDADAVPVGDWHLPRHVGFALAGEARADDARMLELLEPFRPHRARAWRLIVAGTAGPPRRAPRARIIGLLQAEARGQAPGRRKAR